MSLVLDLVKDTKSNFDWQTFIKDYYNFYHSLSPQQLMLFGVPKTLQPIK